ncbi:hypothetical protein H6G00_26970 [Leptolyngbya sp. FACHB-541]|uniref:hypothetical protein n=1 Tax=Leptolyngbya sp. FACHB-541 TaxID=2692810 RepID=UPI00168528C9|nr:hypothetical protein [Leptolyngbya sp. FACHB-541]MBD2000207.1 hypothetical protein [Leptolyngbya sp. FACHB-541]
MNLKLWVPSFTVMVLLLGHATVQPVHAEPTAHIARASWQVFSPSAGGFSVSMPGQPTERLVQEFLHMFSVEHDGRIYAVGYAELDQERLNAALQENPDGFWNGIRRGLLQDGEADLTGDRPISLNGYTGREIEYEDADGLTGKVRVFVVNQRLYQVMAVEVADGSDIEDSEEAEAFLESFQLLAQ